MFYRRYVDDTFFVFEMEHDADLIFPFINFKHPNIRSSIEKDVGHELPFLYVLIHNGILKLLYCVSQEIFYWPFNQLF